MDIYFFHVIWIKCDLERKKKREFSKYPFLVYADFEYLLDLFVFFINFISIFFFKHCLGDLTLLFR